MTPKLIKCTSFSLYLSIITQALHEDQLSFCRIQYLTDKRKAIFEESRKASLQFHIKQSYSWHQNWKTSLMIQLLRYVTEIKINCQLLKNFPLKWHITFYGNVAFPAVCWMHRFHTYVTHVCYHSCNILYTLSWGFFYSAQHGDNFLNHCINYIQYFDWWWDGEFRPTQLTQCVSDFHEGEAKDKRNIKDRGLHDINTKHFMLRCYINSR